MDFLIPILNTLAIAALLILLMVGLMSAPWQVLLLILVLGILSYQWLIRRHHLQSVLKDINTNASVNQGAVISNQPEKTAQATEQTLERVLRYRGTSYTPVAESEAPHPTVEVTGQYRGGIRKFLL